MNVMRAFTRKSLWHNKKRTIVTIIGVIISTAMITAVSVFVTSFLSMMQRSEIADGGNWHVKIQSVQAVNVDAIAQSDATGTAIYAQDIGSAMLDGSQNQQKPYVYIRNYDTNGFAQMSIRLLSGRLPQRSGEVIISQTVANSAGVGFQIDDTMTLTIGKRVTLDGEVITEDASLTYSYNEEGTERTLYESLVPDKTATYTIVGIMERPGFEYSWSAGCGVAGYLDKSALAPSDTLDVYLTANHLSRDIYKTMPDVAAQIGKTAKDVTYNDSLLRTYGVVANDNLFTFLVVFAAVIIVIIVIASVSLIYNAFAISVSERAKQLGLLASVGATKRQKRSSIYYEAFFIGLIGIPLGILAGIGGMGITLFAIRPLLGDVINTSAGVTLSLVVSPFEMVLAFALSVITIFISAYIPARRASQITPIDAIRQTEEVRLTRKNVKTSKLTRKLFGFEAEIALKNLKRSRKKYRATIVSLVISLVLFLTVSTYVSMTQMLSGASYEGYNFDISIDFGDADGSHLADISASITSIPLVTSSTQTTKLGGSVLLPANKLSEQAKQFHVAGDDGDYVVDVQLITLDDESFAAYAKQAGINVSEYTDVQHPKAVLINYAQENAYLDDGSLMKLTGDILLLHEGETVSFNPGGLRYAYNAMNLTVGKLTDERPMGTPIQTFHGAAMVVSQKVFQSLTGSLPQEIGQYVFHNIYVTTSDDQTLERQLSALSQSTSPGFGIYNIRSAARAEQNLAIFLGVFVYGFIILISLICIANIFNTVSTNIALRRKEFAMLRSVGMTPKSFNRMIRFESIFYGLKGLLYGLPISLAISVLLNYMQRSVMLSSYILPWKSYAFAIVMILVIVFTTMLYATGRIKKENIIDALKEESF